VNYTKNLVRAKHIACGMAALTAQKPSGLNNNTSTGMLRPYS